MPKINFNKVDDVQDFSPIPEGIYPVEIIEVIEDVTGNGNECWKLKLEVTEGNYKGRKIHDTLIFTEKAYNRIKKIYSAIGGFDMAKAHDCQPVDISNEKVNADIIIEEYTDKNGNIKKANRVTFAGYSAISTNDVPF